MLLTERVDGEVGDSASAIIVRLADGLIVSDAPVKMPRRAASPAVTVSKPPVTAPLAHRGPVGEPEMLTAAWMG